MAEVRGKFTDQDSYVLSQLLQSVTSNAADLNVVVQENDYLRSTSVVFHQQSLTANPSNLVPTASNVAAQTVNSGVSDGTITPDGEPVERPCFVGWTAITMKGGTYKAIKDIQVGKDWVKSFDRCGNRIDALVIGKWEHWSQESLLVKFADGRETHTHPIHKYWVKEDIFEPIFHLNRVWHWDGGWKVVEIIEKKLLKQPIMLYNITVDTYHSYEANGDAVSNLKPIDQPGGGF